MVTPLWLDANTAVNCTHTSDSSVLGKGGGGVRVWAARVGGAKHRKAA